jgi:hypothetical protein
MIARTVLQAQPARFFTGKSQNMPSCVVSTNIIAAGKEDCLQARANRVGVLWPDRDFFKKRD